MGKKDTIKKLEESNELIQEEQKRKRLEELKLKDKLAQFDRLIKNMSQKIEALEDSNRNLQKEIENQDSIVKQYVSKDTKRMMRRNIENSVYGIPKGTYCDPKIKNITDCRTLEDLYRFNPDPDMVSEKYGDVLPAFDKPNKINSDQYAVNLAMGNTRWNFKRFFANQSTKEIYIQMESSSSNKYLVINFAHKTMRYSIIELFTDPNYPDPAHFIRKEVYTCGVKMHEEPSFIYVNTGNWVIKNLPTMGKNFCLYIDFLKWRVSMYRYESSSNSWVIHDFIELIRGMDISWADEKPLEKYIK